ncbi:Na+/H+ antiporter NhaA [Gulosibacter chungangensis]|uniref:Na(+)/H(+) antiporter NhaA n=1 Tax=Gulosibacter chungangensis TaxID=979746 RepID=A0A7J5BFC5_9MICO|nr:Na+/H+ antiporter NhaA [Gulosibacter chungangensis]KAB1644976.1 Na+/H+ antiporter NhaA [Gulosibacter chungangensis]
MALLPKHRPDDTFSLKERLNSRKVGGTLLLAAAVIAMILANTPLAPFYNFIRDFDLSIPALGMHHMTVAHWASDGILAIFFFVVGIELKREFVTGQLRDPRKASLPIAAAVGGMAVPALVYTVVVSSSGVDALEGWAIPVATDIAFALGLLAVFGKGLPSPFRAFLLTLAVMDDLLGIIVIAIFYTDALALWWLVGSLVVIALYALCVNRGWNPRWLLIPLGVIAWYFMLRSGVHATIAGVLLGLAVPARPIRDDKISLAEDMEHDWNALSQGLALPVFAFFAAGVPFAAGDGTFLEALANPVFLGAFLGLFVGKPIGIFLTVALLHRSKLFRLDSALKLWDIAALGGLAGIGFTVSLLIGELAFRGNEAMLDYAHLGVILGSIAAAFAAIFMLRLRERAHHADALPEGKVRMP